LHSVYRISNHAQDILLKDSHSCCLMAIQRIRSFCIQFTEFQTMRKIHLYQLMCGTKQKFVRSTMEMKYRMDILWSYLENFKDTVTGQPCFSLLTKVAKLVLTLPYSNADKERVFSLIRQNKTAHFLWTEHFPAFLLSRWQ